MLNPQTMQSYIQKVCSEAAVSENKPDNTMFQMCIINDYVIVSIKSPYIRVSRKILYRLAKNFNQNFKSAQLKLIASNKTDMRLLLADDIFDSMRGFDVFPLSQGIDPNFSIAYWEVFGKPCSLQSFRDNSLISEDAGKPGTKYANLHFENLVNYSGDPAYGVNTKSWNKYTADYQAIYNHDPYVIKTTYKNY